MELKEALRRIEKGELFALEWVTCSKHTKSGGEIKQVDGLRLLVQEKDPKDLLAKPNKHVYRYDESVHYMNLWHAETGRFYRVYKRLMLTFNGQEITY